jgi:hypothetical protein
LNLASSLVPRSLKLLLIFSHPLTLGDCRDNVYFSLITLSKQNKFYKICFLFMYNKKMCTLVILRRPNHDWPLIIAANRDEKTDRPSPVRTNLPVALGWASTVMALSLESLIVRALWDRTLP